MDGIKYDIQKLLASAPNRGQIVLLLGTAADGPVRDPARIKTPEEFQRVFGDPAIGDLGQGFLEMYKTNPNLQIHLMRISGSQAIGRFGDSLLIQSRYGGTQYNALNISFATIKDSQEAPRNAMIITVSNTLGEPLKRINYFLDNYQVVNDLVRAISTDARSGISPISCSTLLPYQSIAELWTLNQDTGIPLTGGADGLGLSKNERYIELDECYALLEGLYLDIIIPMKAFFDDSHPVMFYGSGVYGTSYYASKRDYLSMTDREKDGRAVTFHEQLISFCQRQAGLGVFTHGVIGMNPVDNPDKITNVTYSYIHTLVNVTAFKDRHGLSDLVNGEWQDKGQYISVVAGEFVYKEGTTEEYYNNFYIVYAAMIATLFGNTSTTNQVIPMADITLRYEFSTEEIKDLAFLGVVCPRFSVKKGIVISNGVTAALAASDMHYISNVRMLQITMALVDNAMQDLIGENILPVVINRELDSAVSGVLSYLASTDVGILKGYSYSIKWDVTAGRGHVDLKLMTRYAFEYTGVRINMTSKR